MCRALYYIPRYIIIILCANIQNHRGGGPERGHIALFGQSDTICGYRTHTVGGGVTCRWRRDIITRFCIALHMYILPVRVCMCAWVYSTRSDDDIMCPSRSRRIRNGFAAVDLWPGRSATMVSSRLGATVEV